MNFWGKQRLSNMHLILGGITAGTQAYRGKGAKGRRGA
jgi:hypothetical protein